VSLGRTLLRLLVGAVLIGQGSDVFLLDALRGRRAHHGARRALVAVTAGAIGSTVAIAHARRTASKQDGEHLTREWQEEHLRAA
jgi:hypothetical protein